jgi:uncharacterized protein YecT (DUF1311 family)
MIDPLEEYLMGTDRIEAIKVVASNDGAHLALLEDSMATDFCQIIKDESASGQSARIQAERENCPGRSMQIWDAELNKTYRQLRKDLSPGASKALQKSETLWTMYRDAEFSLIDRLYENMEAAAKVDALAAKEAIIKRRLQELYDMSDV